MLRIQPKQMEALRTQARVGFVRRLHAYLDDLAPVYLAGIEPAAAEATVDALVSRAQARGFRRRDQIRRYAVVEAVASGRATGTPPAWFDKLAGAKRPSPALRLLALEDALIHLGRQRETVP